VIKTLETAVIKTVAAFANSRQGGTLLIGVADGGTVHGLESDYASLRKAGRDDRDLFGLHLNQVLINALGETAASSVSSQTHTVDGADLCRVHVPPSTFPVDANVKVDKGGQLVKKTAFYIRVGNGTREIGEPAEKQKYLADRWGNSQGPGIAE
jgi:predicted HTH transcriptional regulator